MKTRTIRTTCLVVLTAALSGLAAGKGGTGSAPATLPPVPLFRQAPGSPFPSLAPPADIAAVDVNGDRKTDLVVAEPAAGVAVFLGNGAGGFTPAPAAPSRVAAGPAPHHLAAGDIDGDGSVDLALTSHDSHEIALLKGDGLGGFWPTFGPPVPALAGGKPHNHGLALVDVDGDRRLDLVTSNAGDASVSVLRGDGKGHFTPAPGSPFRVGRGPYPLVLGDLDGDGRLDLVTPDIDGGTLSVLLGTKEGFRPGPGSPMRVTARPYFVALGDIDGDRDLDLAVTHDDTNLVSIFLGDGHGAFRPAPGSPFDTGPRGWGASLADLDGDGRADLAIAAPGGIRVLLGDGKGRFAPAPGSPLPTGQGVWRMTLADLDKDGALDIMVPDYKEETITVFMGTRRPRPARQ